METRANLIKELTYRASYRGTLELDTLCRGLLPHLESLEDEELDILVKLLQQPENSLMNWLVEGKEIPAEWKLPTALLKHLYKKTKGIQKAE